VFDYLENLDTPEIWSVLIIWCFSASTRQNNVYIRVVTLSYLAPRLNSYRYLGIALLKATATVLPTPYI